MTAFVALLRAVNVGGTGKLPMATLKAFCEDAGITNVRTYIASGNVVFDSRIGAAEVEALLETRLATYAGRQVDVLVRSGLEMAAVVAANVFYGDGIGDSKLRIPAARSGTARNLNTVAKLAEMAAG